MITDKKVLEAEYTGNDIMGLLDRPSEAGITAAQLKARFDGMMKTVLLPKYNSLIDTLAGVYGASNIGFERTALIPYDDAYLAIKGAYSYAGTLVAETQIPSTLPRAENISVADAGGFYAGDTTEEVLQELGSVMVYNPSAYTGTSTEKLQAAIDECMAAEKALMLPNGFIATVTTLSVTCDLIGIGKVLLNAERLNVVEDDITISNLSLNMFAYCAIGVTGTAELLKKNIKISNVEITYDASVISDWLSIRGEYVENLIIEDCHIERGGIELRTCDNFRISGNKIDIQWYGMNEAIHVTRFSKGLIHNNTILNANEAMDLYTSGERCIVTNNRCIGLNKGIELKITLRDSPYTSGSSDQHGYTESTIVQGNIIRNFIPLSSNDVIIGISLTYIDSRGTPTYGLATAPRSVLIADNIIEDFYVTYDAGIGIAYFTGIAVDANNCIVSNNIIRNIHTHAQNLWGTCGIQLANNINVTSKGNLIIGNLIAGCEGTGIDIKHAENCVISNNIIRKDEATGLISKYGIRMYEGTFKFAQIIGNLIECGISGGIGIYGADRSTPVILEDLTILGNTLIDCGIQLATANRCNISNNIISNALNSVGIALGNAALTALGNSITNNKITVSDDYAIQITYQRGFSIIGNYGVDSGTAFILSTSPTADGIIKNNISYSQTGTDVVRLLNASAPELATILNADNIKFT